MKFILLILFMISTVHAKNCSVTKFSDEVQETVLLTTDVPNHLKGAKIIVRLADGRESEVAAEQFKVVPRVQQRLISKVKENTTEVCRENVNHLNRVSVLAGSGPKEGLDKKVYADHSTAKTKTGFVGGVQYQRLLNEHLSIGVQGQSNKSGALMIGVDF